MDEPIDALFVYGTLKRGEERSARWPRPATSIEAAEIRAALYDLGPYPAIVEGYDRVAGELWRFALVDMPETLRVLDAIECYDQGGVDLYVRKIVAGVTAAGEKFSAFAYFYGDPRRMATARRVAPDASGVSRWTKRL